MSSVVFSQNRMTILPKKKSSQAKADRDNPGGVDPVAFPPRGLPPTQVRIFCHHGCLLSGDSPTQRNSFLVEKSALRNLLVTVMCEMDVNERLNEKLVLT